MALCRQTDGKENGDRVWLNGREQTLWLPRERGGGEGMDWEFGLADASYIQDG